MTLETLEKMLEISRGISSLEQAIWLGACFIWGTGFYILHQMFRLKFLKLLIWSEVAGIGYWFWAHRAFFFHSWLAEENPSHGKIITLVVIGLVAELLPLILGTTGAVMGLGYVQKLWKERQSANPPPE